MKKITLSLVATIALLSTSANAFLVPNSEQCSANESSYSNELKLSSFEDVSTDLTEAAGKIDALDSEPMAFTVDMTLGTAVRATQAGVDVVQEGTEAIYKIATFAADTPQCAGNANNVADGIDCIVQLPNKVITMTMVARADIGRHIVVGVYSVGSGALGAIESLSMTIAEGLQEHGAVGNVLSTPFVIIGVIAQGAELLAEIVLYDTVGGAFSNLGKAAITIGTDVCDILSSLVHLRIDKALYHSFGLGIDVVAEGVNLLLHIVTLGKNSLRDGNENSWKNNGSNVDENWGEGGQ